MSRARSIITPTLQDIVLIDIFITTPTRRIVFIEGLKVLCPHSNPHSQPFSVPVLRGPVDKYFCVGKVAIMPAPEQK